MKSFVQRLQSPQARRRSNRNNKAAQVLPDDDEPLLDEHDKKASGQVRRT